MAKCDCNNHHHDYDPVDHHHPKHPPYMVDRCADECDDQLPLLSQVGRGLRGDAYRVEIARDGLTETILEGLYYDEHSGAWVSDWFSQNINGGHLSYQYNLRPFTDPQTFTITFKYVRPGREADEHGTVWSWTTPAIPYLWSRQEDGSMSDGEDIVGSGVATLYLKKTTEGPWNWRDHEKLVYPDGFTHEDMNTPEPEKGWTVNLQYGIGGDIDAPNIDDIAKILGITKENIYEIIQNSPVPTDTIPDENLKKYIDRRDKEDFDTLTENINDLNKHIHRDMGFGGAGTGNTQFPEDGKTAGSWKHPFTVTKGSTGGETVSTAESVKGYVDEGDKILRDRIKNLEAALDDANAAITNLDNKYKKAIGDILNKIYGGGTLNANGSITWPEASKNIKIPLADLNVFGGDTTPAAGVYNNAIRSRGMSNNDVWAR